MKSVKVPTCFLFACDKAGGKGEKPREEDFII
jgi:hypothetical protein